MKEHPKVSFCLFAYNQEKYIEEALEGLFQQDYEPDEIILSDDCSADSTFARIEEYIRNKDQSKIVLNRNEGNLGIARHVNLVNKIATGDLLILFAGDDISLPHRASLIVKKFQSLGADYICSAVYCFSDHYANNRIWEGHWKNTNPTRSTRREAYNYLPSAIGASEAWSSRLARNFSPLRSDVWAEDKVFAFRAFLTKSFYFVDEPLVYYRLGSGVSTGGGKNKFKFPVLGRWKYKDWVVSVQKSVDAIDAKRFDYAVIAIVGSLRRLIESIGYTSFCNLRKALKSKLRKLLSALRKRTRQRGL